MNNMSIIHTSLPELFDKLSGHHTQAKYIDLTTKEQWPVTQGNNPIKTGHNYRAKNIWDTFVNGPRHIGNVTIIQFDCIRQSGEFYCYEHLAREWINSARR